MRTALLFKDSEDPIEVSAEEVRSGLYSRYEEFVDPEYEFKVTYVNGSRNNGRPYFRLYYSYEEYKKLYPERASRYEIVANMRRFKESEWHKKWKEHLSNFCETEKCIKNTLTGKRRFADAFYEKTQTSIEFQHSYIALDFEERNEFYGNLSIKTVWLYDLPRANACYSDDGAIEILEDNARGFFRISESPENLKKYRVYIQVKDGTIYRVNELFRRESSSDQKSTIRYFMPTEIYTESEFIEAIKLNTVGIAPQSDNTKEDIIPKTLSELWDNAYNWIIVKNVVNGDLIRINHNGAGGIFRDFSTGCIKYVYVDDKYSYHNTAKQNKREYPLSHKDENTPIWILVHSTPKICN